MEHARALAVLVAAGRSARMGGAERKPFLELEGRAVLLCAAEALVGAASVQRLVVVVHPEDVARAEALLGATKKLAAVVAGGEERIDSVRAGVRAGVRTAEPSDAWLLIHDGARPLVTPAEVEAVIAAARAHGAALLALPVADTLKRSRDGRFAVDTVERSQLWQAQTPQVFEAVRFRELLARAERERFVPTDDAALWEHYVGPVALVPGSPANRKITLPADLEIARALLRARASSPSSS